MIQRKVMPKLKGVRYPSAQRLKYLKFLNSITAQASEMTSSFLSSLGQLAPQSRNDSSSWLNDRFIGFRERMDAITSAVQVSWFLTDLAKQIESVTQKGFQEQIVSRLGLSALLTADPEQLRALFVQENVRLIRSLTQNTADQIEQLIFISLRQGISIRELECIIQNKLAITKQRAQLIARDQVSKYSGDLTRHNQINAGITHYRWETSRDERVRPEHRALDGKIFAWAEPPVSTKSGGRFHPRQGINCRCDAIPII